MGFSVGFFRCAESESPRLLVGALIARVVGTVALAVWLIAGVLPTPANAAAERRIALVIGNAQYPASKLKNPANDATAMATALRKLGFTVIYREDATQRVMLSAMREFVDKSTGYDVRLFFYAGHGAQIVGKNYLMPLDAALDDERDVQRTAVNLNEFMDLLGQAKQGVNIIVLDACRDNPFGATQSLSANGRRMKFRGIKMPGLATIDAPVGSFVAFAAAPGQAADDGAAANFGVFTKHILEHISTPDVTLEQLFKRVRSGVRKDTDGKQIPWDSSSLTGDFCFSPTARGCGGGALR